MNQPKYILPNQKIILCLLIVLAILLATGINQAQAQGYCATDEMQAILLERNKSLRDKIRKEEQQYRVHSQMIEFARHSRSPHTLPIVVHIIHDGGLENITDGLALQAIAHLNDAFANTGYYDQATGVNTDLQFCLALQDPDGNTTTGITRTRSNLTELTGNIDDVTLKNLIRWDPLSYINVWLVRSICRGTNCDVAGFAYLPQSHGRPEDGIVIEAEWFGSNPQNSSVFVHEMGHYLGLYHTFNGGCKNQNCLQDGDRVCDTPPDQSTSIDNCNFTQNSCISDEDDTSVNNPFRSISLGGIGDQVDMHINYMDYSPWSCYSAFTAGQSERMDFFIHNSRSSLLNSKACDDPCPTPAFADIVELDLILNVGTNFTFHGNVQNPGDLNWTINGSPGSSTDEFSYLFNQIGIFEIIFSASQNDIRCADSRDTIRVEVVCPVNASIAPQTNSCYMLDTIIAFSAGSAQAISYDWFINNVFIGAGMNINLTFPAFGRQRVMLVSSNGICQDTIIQIVRIGCDEICGNGYDDDGDLLVDQYDPDCCFMDPAFEYLCDTACLPQDDFPYSIGAKWTSVRRTYSWSSPLAGDIDNDGEVEVIATTVDNDITIWNGRTGIEEFNIDLNLFVEPTISVADLDGDGDGEIIAIVNRFLTAFHHDGSVMLQSDVRIYGVSSFNNMFISTADFDQDGRPEIYVGNQIFNGQNGRQIVSAPMLSSGEAKDNDDTFGSWQKRATVAVDLLPDDFCANCSGLELAAGNQVLSVDIASGTIQVEREIVNEKDGYTSVADFDRDGDLDIIVSNIYFEPSLSNFAEGIYVWDGQTNTTINTRSVVKGTGSNLGGTIVGNFDDDNDLEIAFISYHVLYLLDNDLSLKWSFDLEEASAIGQLGFDFNLDGVLEIVVRDRQTLYILNARTGMPYYQSSMSSSTVMEMPAIADIDDDGNAEIIVDGNNRINCVGIIGTESWADAARVFNQAQYFNVNTNYDLSVPPEQQQHHLIGDRKRYNSFLNPVAFHQVQPDGELEVIDIFCVEDSIAIEMEVCNIKGGKLPAETPLAIYCGDPTTTSATLITTRALGQDLFYMECTNIRVTIDQNCGQQIFGMLNDDGSQIRPYSIANDFPITDIDECDYENNMDSVVLELDSLDLDLGADTIICFGDSIILNGGLDFLDYSWSDNSSDKTLTAKSAGTYWLHATDSCGAIYRDTIDLSIFAVPTLALGRDTTLCPGVFSLHAGTGFDSYYWSTGERDSSITVYESGRYSVTVVDFCGATQVDEIEVDMSNDEPLDLGAPRVTICPGELVTIRLDARWVWNQWSPNRFISCDTCQVTDFMPTETTTYSVSVLDSNGCFQTDTILFVVETQIVLVDTFLICIGESIMIRDSLISMAGDFQFSSENINGCDSAFLYRVNYINVIAPAVDSVEICLGDSVVIRDSLIFEQGDYIFLKQNGAACDSVFISVVRFEDDIDPIIDSIDICFGDTIVKYGALIFNDGDYNFLRPSLVGCDTLVQLNVQFINPASNTIDSVLLCIGDSLFYLGDVFTGSGTYRFLFPSVDGCDSIHTLVIDQPSVLLLTSNDTIVQAGSPVQLYTELSAGFSQDFIWIPSTDLSCATCQNPIANPTFSTEYVVRTTDEYGCLYEGAVQVIVLSAENGVYIPTAFSPNNDQINDVFLAYGSAGSNITYSISIFNRWGGKVFEQFESKLNESSEGWDGTQNGKEVASGVYAYVITTSDELSSKTFSGEVHLVR